jgi:DNA-binding FadR family transcriptional regulator
MALLRLRTLQHNPGVLDIRSEHRRIYEAVCDRNPIAANQAIQLHLISSKERVIQEIKQLE